MSHSIPNQSALKVCSKCGESKPVTEYHKQGENLRSACKACTNSQNRGIYEKHHDAHLEAKKRYRKENPDARRATVRAYDNRHIQKRRAHSTVKHAIEGGLLPRASDCHCYTCGNLAEIYHHDSYERADWLNVKPMCRACHGKEHHVS